MKLTLLAATLSLTIVPATPKSPLRVSDPVSFQSVGQVRMGMSIGEFKSAIGVPVNIDYDAKDGCGYAFPKDKALPIAFMIVKGKIARTEFNQPGFRTDKGAKVGDSEMLILTLYKGQVQVSQHAYNEDGHYLTIKPKGGKYALVFETNGQVVTSIRVGLLPAAEYIEGCL